MPDYNADEIDRLVREGRDASPNPQDICHCCCIRPAVRRAVARQVTWVSLCDVCLDKHYPEGNYNRSDYFPPDGELIQRNLVAALCAALSAAKAEVDRLAKALDESRDDALFCQQMLDIASVEFDPRVFADKMAALKSDRDSLAAEVERLTAQVGKECPMCEIDARRVLIDKLVAKNTRLGARVRELELTEEERVAVAWLRNIAERDGLLDHTLPIGYATGHIERRDAALALLDRLVKGGR